MQNSKVWKKSQEVFICECPGNIQNWFTMHEMQM